jgi:hypothetical protein
MGVTCSTYGGQETSIQGFRGRTEGKRKLGRPRCVWEDNIDMDPQEREWGGGLDLLVLAQDRDRQRADVNVVMNFWVLKPAENFLCS